MGVRDKEGTMQEARRVEREGATTQKRKKCQRRTTHTIANARVITLGEDGGDRQRGEAWLVHDELRYPAGWNLIQ